VTYLVLPVCLNSIPLSAWTPVSNAPASMKPQRDALGDEAQNASFSHPTWMHARRQPRDHDLYYPYIVNGQRVFMATCWCPRSTAPVSMSSSRRWRPPPRPSAVFTHEFKDDSGRVAKSYGPNAGRLIAAKWHYDPDNIFNSAIPLPGSVVQ
jgi:hypothetical protein